MTLVILLGILGAAGLALALSGTGTDSSSPEPASPALREQVERLLRTSQDPAQIEQAAAILETQGQAAAATALRDHARRLRTLAALAPGGGTATTVTTPPASPQIDWGIPGFTPTTPAPTTPSSSPGPSLDPSIPAVREGIVHPTRLPLLIEAARRVDAALRVRRARQRYNRELVGAFQTAAGLTPDRAYGGMTRAALQYYGVANPPQPFTAPRSGTYTPPADLRSPSPLAGTSTMDPATWGPLAALSQAATRASDAARVTSRGNAADR